MTSWVTDVVVSAGYTGILLLMFMESVFPPIPSEVIMPLAGYVASQGKLSVVGVALAGMAGSVLGALPLYHAGRRLGEERLTRHAERHGRWLALSPSDIRKAKSWFDRHGMAAVFFGRLVPGIRSLISIPAGIARMNLALFIGLTALGTALWSGLLAYVGYFLGRNFAQAANVLDPLSAIVLTGVAAVYIWRVIRFKDTRTRAPD